MSDNVVVEEAVSGTNIAADEVTRNATSEKQQIIKIALGAEGAFDTLVDSGRQTEANSVPVVIAANPVSTANSTTANLAGGAVFTGTSEEVKDYALIQVSVYSSHASATNGLSLQQSSDGTNWDILDTYTIPATTGKVFSIQPSARYFRLVFTNGATLTTQLRIQTIFHSTISKGSSERPSDAVSNENDFEQISAFNMLFNGTTWDRARGDTTNGVDVDVTRVIPGTAATNLGKARDSVIGATDTGIAMLGVRRDTPTAETPAAGDYVVPQYSANGEAWTRLSGEIADDAAFTVGTTRVVPVGYLADETSTDSVDEGDAGIARMTLNRKQIMTVRSITGTATNVSASATSVTLLVANTSREGATIWNDSSAILYLKLGATASTTSCTVKLIADAYYEVPFGYTGIIDGIWASATGSARITEIV